MYEKEGTYGFPPDDETNRRSDEQIRIGATKRLTNSQIAFILSKVKSNDIEIISAIKRNLLLPDDQKDEEYLGDELIEFSKFCESIGVLEREYSITTAFVSLVNSCISEINSSGGESA